MTDWKYEFNGYEIELIDQPAAFVVKSPEETYEDDTVLAQIDAEVHRLNLLIDTSNRDIYKLRKWQRALKKEKGNGARDSEKTV